MECSLSFIALLAVIVVVTMIVAKVQSQSDRWNRAHRALAEKYGGACLPAGWFGYPSVRFHYGAAPVLLQSYTKGGNRYSQVQLQWPDAHFSCEVVPRRFMRSLGRRTSWGNLVSVGGEFDRDFTVCANDAAEARDFLNDGARWQVQQLQHFMNRGNLEVSVVHGVLAVKKGASLWRFEDLETFVQMALDLYDQALLTRDAGIQFMGDGVVQTLGDAHCPLCGDGIVEDLIFCRKCRTPHHRECWLFYGACSMYACQETSYLSPATASLEGPHRASVRRKPR